MTYSSNPSSGTRRKFKRRHYGLTQSMGGLGFWNAAYAPQTAAPVITATAPAPATASSGGFSINKLFSGILDAGKVVGTEYIKSKAAATPATTPPYFPAAASSMLPTLLIGGALIGAFLILRKK